MLIVNALIIAHEVHIPLGGPKPITTILRYYVFTLCQISYLRLLNIVFVLLSVIFFLPLIKTVYCFLLRRSHRGQPVPLVRNVTGSRFLKSGVSPGYREYSQLECKTLLVMRLTFREHANLETETLY